MTSKDAQRDWRVTYSPNETGAMEWSGPWLPNSVSKGTKAFFYKTDFSGLRISVSLSTNDNPAFIRKHLRPLRWQRNAPATLAHHVASQKRCQAQGMQLKGTDFHSPKDLGSAH